MAAKEESLPSKVETHMKSGLLEMTTIQSNEPLPCQSPARSSARSVTIARRTRASSASTLKSLARSIEVYDDPDSSDDEEQGRYVRFQIAARRTIKKQSFNSMMIICFFFALFGHDLFNCLDVPDEPWNMLLDIGMCFATLAFIMEVILYWAGDYVEYAWTLLCSIDLVSIFSMLFEISFIWGKAGQPEKMGEESTVQLARATRAAKVGARAFRFLKLLKLLNCLERSHRQLISASEWQRKALSRNLMTTLSNRIAALTIVMVVCLPLIDVDHWAGQDVSTIVWCERLEFAYKRAWDILYNDPDLTETLVFAQAIQHMAQFYAAQGMARPFKVHGFPERFLMHGKIVSIPGQNVLANYSSEPSRQEFVFEYELDSHHNDSHVDRMIIFVNNMRIQKLKAVENIIMVAFVLVVVLFASHYLRQSLDPLLDVEKQAEYAKILLKNNVVEEAEMEYLSMEDKAVIQGMMHLGPKKRRTFKVHQKSLNVPERVVETLPFEEDLINSICVNYLECDWNACNQLMKYILFDSELSRHSGRLYTNVSQFQQFYEAVRSRYLDPPYHNFSHACDVTHWSFRVLVNVHSPKWATNVEHYAVLLSALCHDVGHPGTTNAFSVEIGDEYALRYNDASPLENMHCATLFEICQEKHLDMFETMTQEEKKLARKVCISVILHTDLVHHFKMVKDLDLASEGDHKKVVDAQAKNPSNFSPEYEEIIQNNHMMLLEYVLHQSDISNPVKPFETGKMWTWRVMDEFFAQGDKEKELGLPVGMMNDRTKINRYGSQHGFITFLAAPLILSATRIFHTLMPLCDNMGASLMEWHKQWQLDAAPPREDVEKRAIEVAKIDEKIRELARRAMDENELKAYKLRPGYLGLRSRSRGTYASSQRSELCRPSEV